MMTNFKKGKISSYQLFSALFVSRIIVTLTYIQNVSVGKLSSDLLISVFFGMILSLLLCLPICMCIKKRCCLFNNKFLSFSYASFFIFNAAIGLTRFSYFATSRFNTPLPVIFYVIIVLLSSCYAANLGLEPLARFACFCAIALLFVTITVIVFNVGNADLINLYPVVENSKNDVLKNSVIFASNTIEPAIVLAVSKDVNANKIKPMIFSITSAFTVIFILIFMCMVVMGSGASLQAYPIFTLFQMASVGSISRFDMLHTGFWMLALLLKTSLLIYSSSNCLKQCLEIGKTKRLNLTVTVSAFVVSIIMIYAFREKTADYLKSISFWASIFFVFAIPFVSSLIVKRRRIFENN